MLIAAVSGHQTRADDLDEVDLIAEAHAQGCGVLVKKALNSGRAQPTSLNQVADHPGVSSIVVGTLNPDNLNPDNLVENARLLDG